MLHAGQVIRPLYLVLGPLARSLLSRVVHLPHVVVVEDLLGVEEGRVVGLEYP